MNEQTVVEDRNDPIIQVRFQSDGDERILSPMFLKNVIGTTGYITDKETEHYGCKTCMVFERDHGSESVVYEIEITHFDPDNPNLEWVRLADCLDKCTNWAVREGYMHDGMLKRITRLISRDLTMKAMADISIDLYPLDISVSIIGKENAGLWRPLFQ